MNLTTEEKIEWIICVYHDTQFKRLLGFPSKLYYINLIIVCIVNILLTISTVSLNTVTIFACWMSRDLRKKKSYFLVTLLSLNDLVTGVLGNSSVVVLLVKTLIQDNECSTYILFEMLAGGVCAMSFMTLFLLNFERYLCIVHPFFHRNVVTKSRLFTIAMVLWSCAITLVFSRLFMAETTRFLRPIMPLIFICGFAYMYMCIFHATRKTAQECLPQRKLKNQRKKLQDIKLAKSCAIVVCFTAICFIPFSVTTFLKPNRGTMVFSVAFWSNTFAMSASSLNSIIFFWRNSILRNEARRVLTCRPRGPH